MSDTDRQSLAKRIKALLAKAESLRNGAGTEAEAMLFAEKARALMDEHRLGQSDLETEAEGFEQSIRTAKDNLEYRLKKDLFYAVAAYTDVLAYQIDDLKQLRFFGRAGDVVFADWLMDALDDYIERACEAYLFKERNDCLFQDDLFGAVDKKTRKQRNNSQQAAWAFRVGAIERIRERLYSVVLERKKHIKLKGHHNALVADHDARLHDELRKRGVTLHRARPEAALSAADAAAMLAGHARGDAANFDRPINGTGKVLEIGGY